MNPPSKLNQRNSRILFLACLHRYVLPILVILLPMLFPQEMVGIGMGIGGIAFAAHDLLAFKLRRRYFYCSYQNAHRQKMTPEHIVWSNVKKLDVYIDVAFWGIFGVFFLLVSVLKVW